MLPYELQLWVFIASEGLDVFKLKSVGTVGRVRPSDSLTFTERTSVGWMNGS